MKRCPAPSRSTTEPRKVLRLGLCRQRPNRQSSKACSTTIVHGLRACRKIPTLSFEPTIAVVPVVGGKANVRMHVPAIGIYGVVDFKFASLPTLLGLYRQRAAHCLAWTCEKNPNLWRFCKMLINSTLSCMSGKPVSKSRPPNIAP